MADYVNDLESSAAELNPGWCCCYLARFCGVKPVRTRLHQSYCRCISLRLASLTEKGTFPALSFPCISTNRERGACQGHSGFRKHLESQTDPKRKFLNVPKAGLRQDAGTSRVLHISLEGQTSGRAEDFEVCVCVIKRA